MARTTNPGLEYFPMDTSFYDDIKIRKLIKYQGGAAVSVYSFLLCAVYKNDYFLPWDSDLPFMVSERTGLEESFVEEVINFAFDVGLFSREKFDKCQVLTSKGIQDRYMVINKLSKRSREITSELMCITSEVIPITSEVIPITSEVIAITSEVSTQSKVKESKEINLLKKSKRKVKREDPFSPPSVEEVKKYVIESYDVSENAAAGFADKFWNYYDSVNWIVGKGKYKMKSWTRSINVQWKETVLEFAGRFPKPSERAKSKFVR